MVKKDERWSQSADQPIRVLLVDDHEYVLWGLRKLIDGEWPRMKVAGTGKSVSQLTAALRATKPDVVVLDVYLGNEESLGLLPRIQEVGAAALVLTGSRNQEIHRRALDSGACSVVLKEEPAEVLLHEIERAHEWRLTPRNDPARQQDCQSAVQTRIAGFISSITRR